MSMVHQERPNLTKAPALGDLASYHRQLLEKVRKSSPETVDISAGALALIPFSGYYSLGSAPGAFFAIDTNLYFGSVLSTPAYDVSLIVSLDGTKSYRFPFSGAFDGVRLVQKSKESGGQLTIDLTLNRTASSGGPTVSCSGTIELPGRPQLSVSGSTYNNPIPPFVFAGVYYETKSLHLSPSEEEKVAVRVMEIKDDLQVLYDFGKNDGELQPVELYTYNMNMFFFSFQQGTDAVNLIMGTAAAGGFACNDMTLTSSKAVTSRSLQTIPFPSQETPGAPNPSSAGLAELSGYYQIPTIGPGAFLSIQGEYTVAGGAVDSYRVKIGLSIDGKTARGYYFDGVGMTFLDNILRMPDQGIEVTFKREYVAAQGSLVTITGTVADFQNIKGYTLFNPVPLRLFGGVPMTSSTGDSLTVGGDSEVIYNGTTIDNFVYVPIMYILASPVENSTTVMSFGTDSASGNACIVIDGSGTTFVEAIPSPEGVPLVVPGE